MEDLSLHILDIAENSIDAGASMVEVMIKENSEKDILILAVDDNGRGMDDNILKSAPDPSFTGKAGKRFGLGIPLLAQAARECGGDFSIKSEKNKGTGIKAEFKRTHIDIKPIGDIGATMMTLICGHPEIDYSFHYEKDGLSYIFDTRELKSRLGDVPINAPALLKLIKDDINESVRALRMQPDVVEEDLIKKLTIKGG
jgi:hypothetical protein